jgi:two-component system response regulator HydG
LPQEVARGRFREDLFYRLNVVPIRIPALRERAADIPLLANHFLTQFATEFKRKISGFSPEIMDEMRTQHWPGNVRELMNTIERAVVLARSTCLDEEDFSALAAQSSASDGSTPVSGFPADLPLEQIEREAIVNTLASAGGNKSEAARRLGITRKTLREKLKRYHLPPDVGS